MGLWMKDGQLLSAKQSRQQVTRVVDSLLLNFLTKQNNEDFKPDNPTPAWQPHRHQTGYCCALKP
jgi:hypothetical protein